MLIDCPESFVGTKVSRLMPGRSSIGNKERELNSECRDGMKATRGELRD